MTHPSLRPAFIAGLTFAIGYLAARGPSTAQAQSPTPAPPPVAMPSAYLQDIKRLYPKTTPYPISISPAATVQYLSGPLPAHYHSTANEIQYVVSGTGTERFGTTTRRIQPGTVFVIPPGTVHAGMVLDKGSAPLQLLVVKVPQQQPGDVHPVSRLHAH